MALQDTLLTSKSLLCKNSCDLQIPLATWRYMEPGACAMQATAEEAAAKASAIAADTPSEPIESPSELAPSDRIEDSDKEGATKTPQPIAGQEPSQYTEAYIQYPRAHCLGSVAVISDYFVGQSGNTEEVRSCTCLQLLKGKQRVPARRRNLQQSRESPRAVRPRQSMQMSWRRQAWLLKSLKRQQPQRADLAANLKALRRTKALRLRSQRRWPS